MGQAYLDRGVSATKDDVKAAVKNQDRGLFPGAFCKILPDLAGDPDFCMAVHADGAGTKSSLAYLMYKETGDRSYFRGIAQDSLVMNTDDLACIGAVDGFYLSNTIGRNAHRVDGACIAEVINGYDDVIGRLADHGIKVVMTGGETADVGDLVQTLIVDSTITVRLPRVKVKSAADIRPGLAIVGLASFGQATYETTYNSGMGSNGLTAARHMLLAHGYLRRYPETVSPTIPEDKVYCGHHQVTAELPGTPLSVGEAILSPTRTYLPVVRDILAEMGEEVVAFLHCTGGGQVKCKDFGHGIHYIKDRLFELPPLFQALRASGQMEDRELYQVFNMGHRLEVYCEPEVAEKVVSIAGRYDVEAKVIGRTEASALKTGQENRVTISSALGTFEY